VGSAGCKENNIESEFARAAHAQRAHRLLFTAPGGTGSFRCLNRTSATSLGAVMLNLVPASLVASSWGWWVRGVCIDGGGGLFVLACVCEWERGGEGDLEAD